MSDVGTPVSEQSINMKWPKSTVHIRVFSLVALILIGTLIFTRLLELPPTEQLMEVVRSFVMNYGYLAVFLGVGLDHSGVPWILVISSVYAASGDLKAQPLVLCAVGGIVVFDHIYYLLGYVFSSFWIVDARRHPGWERLLTAGEATFRKHGASIVVWGRFVAAIGRFVPLFAGAFSVPYRLFLFYTLLGAGVTIVVFGLIPYVVGAPILRLVSYIDVGTRVLLIAVVLCVLVSITYKLIAKWRRSSNHGAGS